MASGSAFLYVRRGSAWPMRFRQPEDSGIKAEETDHTNRGGGWSSCTNVTWEIR